MNKEVVLLRSFFCGVSQQDHSISRYQTTVIFLRFTLYIFNAAAN